MLAAAGFAVISAGPAAAGTIEVAPTTIKLPAGETNATFYVSNHGTEPLTVQLETFDWRQTGAAGAAGAADRLQASETLLVSPPLAHIAPGTRQTVRLMVKAGGSDTSERAFRLLVSELPKPASKPERGIRMLLQLSVPVFAGAARGAAGRLSWDTVLSDDGLFLTARNEGARHVKLSGLTLVTAKDRRIEVAPSFSYILAGASQSWKVTRPQVAAGETLHIEGHDESTGAAITGTLVAHR